MAAAWTWLNGRKTQIALVAAVGLSILARRGVAIPDEVYMIADLLLGVGVVHKAAKTIRRTPAAPTAGPADAT